MRTDRMLLGFLACATVSLVAAHPPRDDSTPAKVVVIEVFTSQGCDMCPGAEKLLSSLPRRGYDPSKVIVLAFHVDYFNDPWKDPFSKPAFSRRNLAYHEVAQARDKRTPNLYFTPMIMVAGKYPTSGFYHEGEQAAWQALQTRVDRALNEPAPATIEIAPPRAPRDGRCSLSLTLASHSSRWVGRQLLAVALVVEDGMSTPVPSGENEGKTLAENHVVRSMEYKSFTLRRAPGSPLAFDLALAPDAKPDATSIVVLVQDEKSGEILQAATQPWSKR